MDATILLFTILCLFDRPLPGAGVWTRKRLIILPKGCYVTVINLHHLEANSFPHTLQSQHTMRNLAQDERGSGNSSPTDYDEQVVNLI